MLFCVLDVSFSILFFFKSSFTKVQPGSKTKKLKKFWKKWHKKLTMFPIQDNETKYIFRRNSVC